LLGARAVGGAHVNFRVDVIRSVIRGGSARNHISNLPRFSRGRA
jgi:hypothetical protein